MTWQELFQFINTRGMANPSFLNEKVIIYDKSEGEYYDCDLIEIEEDPNDVISPNSIFLSLL